MLKKPKKIQIINPNEHYKLKIMLIGDSGVGKTSLAKNLC